MEFLEEAEERSNETDAAFTVYGRAVDSDGEGVGGVPIVVLVRGSRLERKTPVARTVTEPDGRFRLPIPHRPFDIHTLCAEASGGWYCYREYQHLNPNRAYLFRMQRATRIRGLVLGLDGRPTAAQVTAEWYECCTTATDAAQDGSFTLIAPSDTGSLRLWVVVGSTLWCVPLADREPHEGLVLTPPDLVTIQGEVQDATGAPLNEGIVWLARVGTCACVVQEVRLDGKSNRFSFPNLQPAEYVLAHGVGEGSRAAVSLVVEAPSREVLLRWPRFRLVRGRLISGSGFSACGSGVVFRSGRGPEAPTGFRVSAYSGDPGDGRFGFHAPVGTDSLYLSCSDTESDGYAFAELPPEGDQELTLHVLQGEAIAGRLLTPYGVPPEGFCVWVHPFTTAAATRVSDDGSFRIGSLPPGTYYLVWSALGQCGTYSLSRPVRTGTQDVQIRVWDDECRRNGR